MVTFLQRILPLGNPLSEKSLLTMVNALSSVEFIHAPTSREVSACFCSRARIFFSTPSLLLVPEATICCCRLYKHPVPETHTEPHTECPPICFPTLPTPLLQGLRCPHSSYLGSNCLTLPAPHACFCLVFGGENLVLQAHSGPLCLSLLRFLYVDRGALGTSERAE